MEGRCQQARIVKVLDRYSGKVILRIRENHQCHHYVVDSPTLRLANVSKRKDLNSTLGVKAI